MHQFVCTPPPNQGATPAMVAPVASGSGGCTPRNASQWRHVADFLAADQLSSLGLVLRPAASADRLTGGGSAAAVGGQSSSIPDGNHGDNTSEVAK